jgi:hypothetical protein
MKASRLIEILTKYIGEHGDGFVFFDVGMHLSIDRQRLGFIESVVVENLPPKGGLVIYYLCPKTMEKKVLTTVKAREKALKLPPSWWR